jgi:predicted urease superfamily metal-dependent hydrolase
MQASGDDNVTRKSIPGGDSQGSELLDDLQRDGGKALLWLVLQSWNAGSGYASGLDKSRAFHEVVDMSIMETNTTEVAADHWTAIGSSFRSRVY